MKCIALKILELILVLLINMALVGIGIPFFQNNCFTPTPYWQACDDFEVIRNALDLYSQSSEVPFQKTSLSSLESRYLPVLPKDWWGKPYLFDPELGILLFLGRDRKPGGLGEDQDLMVSVRNTGLTSSAMHPRLIDRIYRKKIANGEIETRWMF